MVMMVRGMLLILTCDTGDDNDVTVVETDTTDNCDGGADDYYMTMRMVMPMR